ncbi:hypothetical protein CNEO4_320011 [Clostridium neonatale]|uniref:Uncharacterized protein n=1 Tax=Clostridium neonatale TaxID=137838 RepID=A0AA86JZC8_9CLOT|nr:hypothetical protein CNEO_44462 [Clostridium neonatale]CAI3583963.1 hypothetical protein CNEO3_170075 [Clostridium neonatale]CAI3600652.1 hypothetical protein CNEO4_330012 [Clostridium neonatale]CAI3627596.1 hypothetical protein CNEO4_320012 [Clostridium neonatale]CAI3633770.1 hypothetical protein CNEO4_320011 [Clostridium neonatale]
MNTEFIIYILIQRGNVYAKDKIPRIYFYNYDGFCNGLCYDCL